MQVTSSLQVDRPAAEAFRFVADAENNPRWQKGMRSCRWTTQPPIHVGSVYEQEATFLGKTIRSTFEVVAFETDRSITIRTVESTFPIQVTRSVEPLDAGRCRVPRRCEAIQPGCSASPRRCCAAWFSAACEPTIAGSRPCWGADPLLLTRYSGTKVAGEARRHLLHRAIQH